MQLGVFGAQQRVVGPQQLAAVRRHQILVALLGGLTEKVLIEQQIGLVGPVGQIVDHQQPRGGIAAGQASEQLGFPVGIQAVVICHQPAGAGDAGQGQGLQALGGIRGLAANEPGAIKLAALQSLAGCQRLFG